jgi:L-amino acid N-acyltransferase YncA
LSAERVGVEQILLSALSAEDWPAVARVYEAGIAGGNATFESRAPSWQQWSATRAGYPAIVARDAGTAVGTDVAAGDGAERAARGAEGAVCGWAALSPTSTRAVYRGVGEVSVYVDPAFARRGIGRALLSALIAASERDGFWTLRAGIFPENAASIALHEACGFERVGVSRRIGQMPDGRWRDVVHYERRSAAVGAER